MCSAPSRRKVTATLVPGSPRSQPETVSALCPAALRPSTVTIRSPARRPPLAAGVSSYTRWISRPCSVTREVMPMPTSWVSDIVLLNKAYSSAVKYSV